MPKAKKVFVFILFIIMSTAVLTGCSKPKMIEKIETEDAVSEERIIRNQQVKQERQITIGVSLLSFDNIFIADVKNAMEAKAKELGVSLIISDGQNSTEKQVSHVENFIAQMVDVIILNPNSMVGCKPAVESANRAGIPIITVNTLVENQDKCVAFVGSDAVESGRIQMEYAARLLGGKGDVIILKGPLGHEAEIGRSKGMKEILDKNPGINVVYEQSANWSRGEGRIIVENCLNSGKHIDAVISQNDEMALGALEAINKFNLTGKIKVFGIDAIPEALKQINEGNMHGTVFQDAKGQGAMAIQTAVKVAKGERVESNIYIPYVLVTKYDVSKYLN
ncbi:MAG TPA: sugar ABC transporter substrate-binding protein [Clostridiaceae bacterium]|nr:sugar ABC transporter substrate-binding protein [Clostridiaceae bacterium]